jgi:hypothetical protein
MADPSPTIVEQRLPAPDLTHLRSLTHPFGVFEHAEYDRSRPEHGFCVDDNARALIVACREGTRPGAIELAQTTLRFVLDARDPGTGLRNRRQVDGGWLDEPRSDDADGRAIWALGVAARQAPTAWLRRTAMEAFTDTPAIDSPYLRPHATAMAGAADVIAMAPGTPSARRLLRRGADRLAAAASGPGPWLEPRLTYDDARLPDGLLAAGVALRDRDLVDRGLDLLTWLVAEQQHEGRFSFTPTGGREPGGPKPAFDQQPLEAAAMADACLRAWFITNDPVWQQHVDRAGRWLVGANDTGVALYDATTGGTFDGLTPDGVNRNRGAESTIAGLAVLQAVRAAGLTVGSR